MERCSFKGLLIKNRALPLGRERRRRSVQSLPDVVSRSSLSAVVCRRCNHKNVRRHSRRLPKPAPVPQTLRKAWHHDVRFHALRSVATCVRNVCTHGTLAKPKSIPKSPRRAVLNPSMVATEERIRALWYPNTCFTPSFVWPTKAPTFSNTDKVHFTQRYLPHRSRVLTFSLLRDFNDGRLSTGSEGGARYSSVTSVFRRLCELRPFGESVAPSDTKSPVDQKLPKAIAL